MPAIQLQLSISAAPTVVKRHGELTYTIRLASKRGPVYGVVVTSTIPANTEYIAGSATAKGIQEQDVIRWNAPEMTANQDHEFSFRVVVLSGDRVLNERYGARCDRCVPASGLPVVTPIESGGVELYMPLIFRSGR
jgi:uncharacterized repeat protein (TIGR01451 family)